MHAVIPLPRRTRLARGLSLLLAALAASPAPARQVSLTVLHTSCLHGRILPADKEGGAGMLSDKRIDEDRLIISVAVVGDDDLISRALSQRL